MALPLICLLAAFPVHRLPGIDLGDEGHHATWLYTLAREWRETPFEIHWITCTKQVSRSMELEAWGQHFHLIPRWKLSVEALTAFSSERRRIAGLLKILQPDLVHGWGTEEGYGYAATDWPGKHLRSMQGLLQVYCSATPQPWLLRLQALHEKRVLRRAKHLTVESPWGREHLVSLAPDARIELLEYGVDPECFEIRRSPSERPLALFVGTLSRLKGADVLLQAFEDPRLRTIDLVLLGEGPLRKVAAQSPPNVKFMGHVSPAEVRRWMAEAWYLIHPARADTSPNCVKEACVIGLPVLTTQEGGQTQYVEEGRNGGYFPSGSVEGLVQLVLEYFLPERRVDVAPIENSERLSPTATCRQLERLIQSVLGGGSVNF